MWHVLLLSNVSGLGFLMQLLIFISIFPFCSISKKLRRVFHLVFVKFWGSLGEEFFKKKLRLWGTTLYNGTQIWQS